MVSLSRSGYYPLRTLRPTPRSRYCYSFAQLSRSNYLCWRDFHPQERQLASLHFIRSPQWSKWNRTMALLPTRSERARSAMRLSMKPARRSAPSSDSQIASTVGLSEGNSSRSPS